MVLKKVTLLNMLMFPKIWLQKKIVRCFSTFVGHTSCAGSGGKNGRTAPVERPSA